MAKSDVNVNLPEQMGAIFFMSLVIKKMFFLQPIKGFNLDGSSDI